MGTVWLARDQLLDREVAVKQVVSTEGLSEDTADTIRQRAMREGRIAARLSHRNAIAMHDVALDSGEPWLVMEYLPSRSVAQILHATGTIDVAQSAQIGAQVADAMVDAHAAGIIHRDIKPGNILIASTGRNAGLVKITDFGISHAKDDVSLTQTGIVTGTPAYFAPEVARGQLPSEASDVYSLGATIYTMLEGLPPFGVDENSLALLHKVARAKINPITKAGALEPILRKLLEPAPARRPTMAQARDELAAVAAAATHTSKDQILTGVLTKKDGALPIWMQKPRPQAAGKASPTRNPSGTQPGTAGTAPSGTRPLPSTAQSTHAAYAPTMSSDRLRFPTHGHTGMPNRMTGAFPEPRPQQQSSTTALALSVFAFFVVLAGVAILLIALLK
ncbi:putative serine/threonine protein kinase [Gordonia amarae NBRC 15530]|uniref:non-specific serine/threonine protein kinase n=2 Tax=Gordonia amarae TaxID=36821 RepID=G7GSD1_9ACTN|nr:putative serine/threonine protein kinase [Gordonia amarae NBRC 15530]